MNIEDQLREVGLTLPQGAEEKLKRYLALLSKWNRVYNLTAIRDPESMMVNHVLDSLIVRPYISRVKTLLDVGSGAGLPGFPLAICCPDLQVISVEANQKKAVFQQQAKIELNLLNVSIHCCRIEDMVGNFDAAISRAFSDLADFVRLTGHLTGRLFAMKGLYPRAELEHLPKNWRCVDSIKLAVPSLEADRHLIVLEKI